MLVICLDATTRLEMLWMGNELLPCGWIAWLVPANTRDFYSLFFFCFYSGYWSRGVWSITCMMFMVFTTILMKPSAGLEKNIMLVFFMRVFFCFCFSYSYCWWCCCGSDLWVFLSLSSKQDKYHSFHFLTHCQTSNGHYSVNLIMIWKIQNPKDSRFV